jgi:hypothetical protein
VPFARFADGRVHPKIGQHRGILAVRPERLFDDGVQDAVTANRCRAGIGQKRKADRVALRVVADSRDTDSLLTELFETTLQLDELRAAERSPVGGAEEHQHCAAGTHDGLQVPHAAGLVSEIEVWDALSHLRSELGDLDFLARLLRRLSGVRTADTENCKECCQRCQTM